MDESRRMLTIIILAQIPPEFHHVFVSELALVDLLYSCGYLVLILPTHSGIFTVRASIDSVIIWLLKEIIPL